MSTHDELVEKAIEAINEVHGDTTVDGAKTIDSLTSLKEHVENLIDITDPEAQPDG